MTTLLRRLRYLLRRRQSEADMAAEMRFHLEQRAADYAADGLSADDARCAARRKFGNLGSIQAQARAVRGWGWIERLATDLGLAVRQLCKSPGFTLLAIVTLGLGVGANTAMFSIINGVLLKPLPYPDSAALDAIYRSTPQNPEGGVAPADYLDLQREEGGYGRITAYAYANASLSEAGQPAEMPRSVRVTPNCFATLGVRPQLGRDFRDPEGVRGNDHVLVISWRYWQNRFGGRADIIGHTVRINGIPHEVVGVLPASFEDWRHLGWADVFLPLSLGPEQATNRHDPSLQVIGRRSGQLTRAQAGRVIATLGARLAADHPDVDAGTTWRAVPLGTAFLGRSGLTSLAMLIGLSGFVLLIACSNLANLLLARTISRAREFAVRSALGASRLQVLRPLITESLVLALAGGVCAVLIALWTNGWIAVRSTSDNGSNARLALDGHVLAWALAASLVTALAFGLAPALYALRLDVNRTLKCGARGAPGGPGQRRFRHLLIVGQFALALVLLAGAALFIRGLDDLNHRRSGWDSAHLVTGTFILPDAGYPTGDRITAFHRLAVQRVESLPGVAMASVSSFTPFFPWYNVRRYVVDGRALPERSHEPAALVNNVGPRYFETVGTRILAGRAFTVRDTPAAPKVFIISQAMAAGLFGNENPIGHRLAEADAGSFQWGEIVGVAADVKSIVPDPGPVTFELYQPMAQEPWLRGELSIRMVGSAASAPLAAIRTAIMKLDPDLPLRRLQPADASIERANNTWTALRDMLTLFAALGLGLASLGIYGVVARTTAQRSGEFAIRLALGASIGDLNRLVLSSGIRLALFGSAIGLVGAVGVARVLAAGFPGMRLDSLSAIAGTTLLLVGVALIACWLPARRAGRVDAIRALRSE